MAPRKVPEWIGKTPDSKASVACQLRIVARQKGKCAITGKKLVPGEFHLDHIVALRDGGENRENNLQAVTIPAHKEKSAEEATDRAKVNALAAKHLGIKRPKGSFARAPKAERTGKPPLPPRIMFWPITGHSESGD